MPRELVELTRQIKAANDIVDVIGGYMQISKNGPRFKCLCPFHNDTNPSLTIDRKYQNYKCWSCGAHGDVFTFVEKYERVNFLEARNILARRAGIVVEESTPQDSHKSKLLDVMKWAQSLYHAEYLNGDAAARARHYIGTRHLSGQSARQFGLGFAPPDTGWLMNAAAKDKIPQGLLLEVGLLGKTEDGRIWERFRDRVMFPIRDVQGRTVGFGGRILPDSPFAARAPKYYNTSDTLLFAKSDNVFGIDLARHAAATAGYLAVVEGYTDVMMAHQCGIAHVVATMGTALNEKHIQNLRRHFTYEPKSLPKIILVFDADEGGSTGVDRALELFIAHDLDLAVAALPPGLDPADLLAEPDGATVFMESLANADDALDFKLNRLLATEARTVDGTRRMLDGILGMLALAPPVPNQASQVKRDLMLTRLAHRLGVEMGTVRGRLKELQTERNRYDRPEPAHPPHEETIVVSVQTSTAAEIKAVHSSVAILERQLIQVLLAEPCLVPEAAKMISSEELSHSGLRRILAELFALIELETVADLDGLRIRLLDRPDLAAAAFQLLEVGRGIPDRPVYLAKIIGGFAAQKATAKNRELKDQLLTVGGDDDAALALLRRLQGPAE